MRSITVSQYHSAPYPIPTMPASKPTPTAGAGQQQQQPPPVSPETIQERLLTREGAGGGIGTRGSLLKCAHRYRDFLTLILSAADHPTSISEEEADAIEVAKESLQRELKLHGLEMRKVSLVAEAAQAELAQYERAMHDIDADAAETRAEIERLKTELSYERQVRKNREEYESLAKMANVRPARRETEEKLAAVKEEMDKIKADEAEGAAELEVRAKQFHLLMQSLNDLKANIAEDEMKNNMEEEAAGGDDMNLDEEVEEGEAVEESIEGTSSGIVEQMDTTL